MCWNVRKTKSDPEIPALFSISRPKLNLGLGELTKPHIAMELWKHSWVCRRKAFTSVTREIM